MPEIIKIDIKGFEETITSLRRLSEKVQRKVVKRAVRAGARPIARQITRNIKMLTNPHKPRPRVRVVRRNRQWIVERRTDKPPEEILAKSVTKREVTYKKDGTFVVVVGPGGKARHAHLIERGTRPRWQWGRVAKVLGRIKWKYGKYAYEMGSRGRYTGRGPKIEYGKIAFQMEKGRAAEIIKDKLRKGILDEWSAAAFDRSLGL